jgi:2-oxo-4-hydroxy-4-carboxy-5-ureidoimidazoline decarboxylase
VSEPGDERAGELGRRDGLGRLNGLSADDARWELLACCAAPGWAAPMAAGRPYASVDALVARSDAVVAGMTVDDLRAALDGHPRIGDRPASPPATATASGPPPGPEHQAGPPDRGWSRGEQAGVAGSGDEVRRGLADGNAAYERRFGHIYLVCAAGRSGAELLAALRDRLQNDPETEWGVVRTELGKINALRLHTLLGELD